MMLPSPKIVVLDDSVDDVQAIVKGLASLGTTALGLHYSPDVIELPRLPGLRILFLDLHLLGSGDDEQQVRNTLGILSSCLTPENGPYAIVLWSSHVSGQFELFDRELRNRFPLLNLPLPLQVVPLDKLDFINNRRIDDPEKLKKSILEKIECCPQLVALLSWEDGIAQATADAIAEIFQMASRRDGTNPAEGLNHLLGQLAAAAIGRANAREDVFRGVNEVLAQVVLDRLLHRHAGEETARLWKSAVTVGEKTDLSEEEAALLNRFLHADDGGLLGRVRSDERGSVVSLAPDQLRVLWGLEDAALLKEFCLESGTYTSIEWIMAQVQPPCDQAQGHACLLPYILGLQVVGLNPKGNPLKKIKKEKSLWISPPLRLGGQSCRLVFQLRFVAGLARSSEFLQRPVGLRLRDQLLTELTYEIHSYNGRPGIIRFSE